MYYVYILFSERVNRYYVGFTSDLQKRLKMHNNGESKFTMRSSDWKIMYTEEYSTRKEAIARERQIKRMKSRKYIEELIKE